MTAKSKDLNLRNFFRGNTMNHRLLVTVILAISIALVPVQESAGQGLATLAAIAKALSDAAASVDKFADGLTKLVKLGDTVGFRLSEAKRAEARLTNIRARTTQLLVAQRTVLIENLDGYINKVRAQKLDRASASPSWNAVLDDVSDVLVQVKTLLGDVKNERSDFVNEDAYAEFLEALEGRAAILGRLREVPPPVTEGELSDLEGVRDKYQVLMSSLGRANAALAEFIKAAEKKP